MPRPTSCAGTLKSVKIIGGKETEVKNRKGMQSGRKFVFQIMTFAILTLPAALSCTRITIPPSACVNEWKFIMQDCIYMYVTGNSLTNFPVDMQPAGVGLPDFVWIFSFFFGFNMIVGVIGSLAQKINCKRLISCLPISKVTPCGKSMHHRLSLTLVQHWTNRR